VINRTLVPYSGLAFQGGNMKRLRRLALFTAIAALTACGAPLEEQSREETPQTPPPVVVVDEDPGEVVTPDLERDRCAEILEQANATQDASLENELEDCLAERLTPIASTSGEEEESEEEESEEGDPVEDLLADLEDAGIEIPDLSECEPLLEAEDLAGFAECVSEALWADADLPELEDECTDLLDTDGPEAFAECVADQLGAEEDLDLPLPEEGECLPLLESDLDAFVECVADELEDLLDCPDDEEEPADPAEEPADPADEPEEPADSADEPEEPSFFDCLDILDQAEDVDESVWDAFDTCVDDLP
jgi:hypothetical protein